MQRVEPMGNLIVKRCAARQRLRSTAALLTAPNAPARASCRLSEHATLPARGSALAAGYDLAAAHECVIPAHGKGLVKTDLAIIVPEGCYGRIGAQATQRQPCAAATRSALLVPNYIHTPRTSSHLSAPRSGLAWKSFIDTGAGVIDADYRGNVGVLLFNHADTDFNGSSPAPQHARLPTTRTAASLPAATAPAVTAACAWRRIRSRRRRPRRPAHPRAHLHAGCAGGGRAGRHRARSWRFWQHWRPGSAAGGRCARHDELPR